MEVVLAVTKKRSIKFEKALDDLEQLVESMEEGDLTLDASLKAFEKGVKLSRECQLALQQAEQTIQMLTESSELEGPASLQGELLEADDEDFEAEDDEDD